MDGYRRPDAGTFLWARVAVFGIGGLALTAMLLFVRPAVSLETVILFVVTGMCYAGFGFGLWNLYLVGREPGPSQGPARFACKHCGRGFNEEKVWRMHERSCVAMRF